MKNMRENKSTESLEKKIQILKQKLDELYETKGYSDEVVSISQELDHYILLVQELKKDTEE